MNKLITASINLSKIDKKKIIDGKTGKWLDLVIWFNDEPDQYGNNLSIQQKTERDEKRIYLGNGKLFVPKEVLTDEPESNIPDLPF